MRIKPEGKLQCPQKDVYLSRQQKLLPMHRLGIILKVLHQMRIGGR